MVKFTLGHMTKAEREQRRRLRQTRRIKRYDGKDYELYKEAPTGIGLFGLTEEETQTIAKRLRRKGWSVRIEYSVWGNTRIWVRRKR